jgi:hypothetical protein
LESRGKKRKRSVPTYIDPFQVISSYFTRRWKKKGPCTCMLSHMKDTMYARLLDLIEGCRRYFTCYELFST